MPDLKEQVLCINRQSLPETWMKKRTVLPMDLSAFVNQCTQSGFAFVDRQKAEQNPGQKQVIPYILLQTQDGSQTAAYNRQGSETRLHNLWSVGIGGHINPIDRSCDQSSFRQILMSGMARELDEELVRQPQEGPTEFAGIISEDITPVGRVHLGAVFRIQTASPHAYVPGPELNQFTWTPTSHLLNLNMELWSELALELIAQVKP
ncbi:MAG: phosphoesterase [Desulfobacter sp.]|nr:phosphoesterase [Desulfobacter sp.]